MDHEASFAPRSVIGPRRAGWRRVTIVVPVLALAAVAWAGASGERSDRQVAEGPHVAAVAAPSIDVVVSPAIATPPRAPRYPAQVLGLDVHRLDDVQSRGLGRDRPIAIAGWYVATEIANCPPVAEIYRTASLAERRGGTDELAFCDRYGVFYASRPTSDPRLRTDNLEDIRQTGAGLPGVAVTLVFGIRVPAELEVIGADAWPVVVIGHLVQPGGGCRVPAGCARELVIDYLPWAAGL